MNGVILESEFIEDIRNQTSDDEECSQDDVLHDPDYIPEDEHTSDHDSVDSMDSDNSNL